jgi:hypothetical protein
MGSTVTKFDNIVYDTGEPWFTIKTSDCSACSGTTYDVSGPPATYRTLDISDASVTSTYLNGVTATGI